ncbi:hypothetical protein K438DRAFT_1969145 [Mycena galopus ATCC 62051]|nr:hypothetical protein K438DRAFT_1969145 [Mycena galopus ATCC 62051]
MLLGLIIAQLLSNGNGSAASLAHPLDPRSTDSCDDINHCRKPFDVVWGCLATIFACTWVSVHPNVPPPDQSSLALFWGRLKMMLIAIIAPEIMVGFAAVQCSAARRFSKEFGFSKTHGFFLCMGGFVSSAGTPIATDIQLRDSPALQEAIRNINIVDIVDKSKGDALSKGVALGQGLWFAVQCIARLQQRLAVTELEVATLAFAAVSIFLGILWWDKPLGVQRPITVHAPNLAPPGPHFVPALGLRQLTSVFFRDFISPLTTESARIVTLPSGIVFGAIHCAAWNADFPTAAEKWTWRYCALLITAIPAAIVLPIALRSYLVSKSQQTIFRRATSATSVIILGTFTVYILARMILIALPAAGLRDLPPSAFMDVDWSRYIPHTL